MSERYVSTGLAALDDVLQGLRLGDNVVWQVDRLEDYHFFLDPFLARSMADRRRCVYVRFADHPPVVPPGLGVETVCVDPGPGFDIFSREVHRLIEARGQGVFYIFDNLSALVAEWATDELLANFFQVTCPYLYELDTVTYFAVTRGKHAHHAIARIRDTTQLLIDVFQAGERLVLHPIKVWDRYSPQMFLPHTRMDDGRWVPVFQSGEAATVLAAGLKSPLRDSAAPIAPWNSVYERLLPHRAKTNADLAGNPELAALKQELCHMLIGAHPEFSPLADRYFTLADLLDIRERVIGSGRIGGKAAGMLLARRMLQTGADGGASEFAQVLEPHDSFYIGSDVFFTFLVNNDLFRLRLQLTRESRISHEEFAEVEKRFLQGRFPAFIMEQFRRMLDYFGQAPIIVRSSSLLEDSFGNAFAGKYRSEFRANQGDPEARLAAFLDAVRLVYASALNPDALTYRRKRGLGDNDEQMAILVQRVSGMPYGQYFFPSIAGVAFSRNLYAWNDRIDPRKGMIRLVFGLGTHAVDRVGGDYPRMVAISHPHLRPETGAKIARYSQRQVDALDLRANQFVTTALGNILAGPDYPNLHLMVSVVKDGEPTDPVGKLVQGAPQDYTLTFNNLLRRTRFVALMDELLTRIENAYGKPIDTEFTAAINEQGELRINLLQCRPLYLPGAVGGIEMPGDVPAEDVLFRANRMICGGVIKNLRFILYVDPRQYAAIPDLAGKRELARVVGRINNLKEVAEGGIVMMGPGRWGSSNIDLGVHVGYADIDNAKVLVELAREEAGQVPEVSYGTHFFQDLVEAQVIYLPVYPNQAESQFNEPFFSTKPNNLANFLQNDAIWAPFIKLFDVPACSNGKSVSVLADPQSNKAICYIK